MFKSPLLWMLLLLAVSSCYSLKNRIDTGKPYNEQINWPDGNEPSVVDFYIHNRIDIEARPERVWDLLIEAEAWPDWYEGMKDVQVLDQNNGHIASGSKLKFNTI